MLSTTRFSSLRSLLLAAPIGLSTALLSGCIAEAGYEEDFYPDGDMELVEESSQALALETCNGIDDNGDFRIDEGGVCDCDKYVYAGHEYLVCQDQINHATGLAMCEARGFGLARVQSQPENDFLQPFVAGSPGFWLDLNDHAVEGSYVYSNGASATFLPWAAGEPNNLANEDCGTMLSTGKWNDFTCAWTRATFCELLDPITWTAPSKASTVGTRLAKTAGLSWDAGASSVQSISSGNGYAQLTVDEVSAPKAFGLSADTAGSGWNTIDYAIVLTHLPGSTTPNIQIWENGGFAPLSSHGQFATGDVFRVEIVDGEVRYLRNGALMYAHATTPVYPLYVDVSLGGNAAAPPVASVNDVRLHACGAGEAGCIKKGPWTRARHVLAKDGVVKKVAGVSWDAGASTVASVPSSGARAMFRSPADGKGKLAGLAQPHDGHGHANVKYGILLGKDGAGNPTATAWENGSAAGGCVTKVVPHADGDLFSVELTSTTVTYKKNNQAFCSHATVPPAGSVVLDVLLQTPDSVVQDLTFGAL